LYPFIHIGPLTLGTYGLMVATGLICAFFILRADFARRGISADAEAIIGITGLSGLVGSRLYHLLETPAEFFADPWPQLFSTMGFAFFGAVIGGFLALLFLAWRFRMRPLLLLDVASPAGALGYGIGRIGCLISGDGDYGIPTSLPWGMSFPNGIVPTTERVHPTPIYEFLVAVVIFWILWRLGERTFKTHAPNGIVFAAYLVLTGIARFLVEFIRINPCSIYWHTNAVATTLGTSPPPCLLQGLTNAQVASVASIVAGVILFVSVRGVSAKPRRA
jgi:phosphatidylglycerol:prolipoprotein diacylglycerol transferase